MTEFKQGDRVKFRSETSQEWVGTVMMGEVNGHVVIGSDIGIYLRSPSETTKVPQSMKHQLIPHDPIAETREIARRYGALPPDDESKKRP